MRRWRTDHDLGEETAVDTNAKYLPPYKNRQFILFMISTVIMSWVFMQWFHTVPVLIKKEWGFDERHIGLLMAVSCAIVASLEMPIIHSVEEKKKVYPTLMIGLLLVGLSYLCFLLPAGLWVCFLAVIIWTFGEILHLPLNTSVAVNMSPTVGRGDYMAWYFMCWAFANIFGPLVGLSFAEKFGFKNFWIFLFMSIIISMLVTRKLKSVIKG